MKLIILLRKRFNFLLKVLFIISFVFIVYQFFIFMQLLQAQKPPTIVKGTHSYQQVMYEADEHNKFTCITSFEKIDFSFVNDDYCDCLDGSDEPATNACPNGQFFCQSQVDIPNFKKILPSSWVNDGICDCCDGSDEWLGKTLNFALNYEIQKKLHKYSSPCPKIC